MNARKITNAFAADEDSYNLSKAEVPIQNAVLYSVIVLLSLRPTTYSEASLSENFDLF